MISLPTKAQWKSVITNTLLTFAATLSFTLSTSPELSTAVVKAAVVSALMASFKTLQKLLTEEKLS